MRDQNAVSQFYVIQRVPAEKLMYVIFQARTATDEDWSDFQEYVTDEVKKGHKDWDFDLRQMNFIGSRVLGILVNLNMLVIGAGGHMRLIVRTGSQVEQVLGLAQIPRIIPMVRLSSKEKRQSHG